VREFDAQTALVAGADPNAPYLFVRDYTPPADWLNRLAPHASQQDESRFFTVYHLGPLAAPERSVTGDNGPLLGLLGYSLYAQDPAGIALFWRVEQLPTDRTDIQATLTLYDAGGQAVTQDQHTFGVPPMEWASGDEFVEWYSFDSLPSAATQFVIQQVRGATTWQSGKIPLE
jgi:hypothetical protein